MVMTYSIFHIQKLKRNLCLKKQLNNLFLNDSRRRWSSKYFITTPIFYVNAEPHIGHLYTAVIGDAATRFQKLKNPDVITKFMVGTDEHGLKVSQSAAEKNMDVKSFCDSVSNKYKEMFNVFNVQYDDFVRTTEDRHIKAVASLWNKILSKNLIYSDKYSGWYSIADEAFVTEQYLDPKPGENGERYTLEGHKQVHFMEETNYKFKLSNFKDDLLHWLKGNVVTPKLFLNSLIAQVESDTFNDISVSRPADRVSWGVSVPGDPSQTIYVWFDALSSYLCSSGYPNSNFKWPPDVQIVGKDILRFHGIFWPAILMAADLEPPKTILCHSHWMKDNEKMSKTVGNVVDPLEICEKYTSEGLRYFLLRGGVPHSDGNFSESKITIYLNAELSDTLGNLLLRIISAKVNPKQVFPSLPENYKEHFDETCQNLMNALEELPEKVSNHFEEFNFYKGIDEITEVIRTINGFIQSRTPWSKNRHEDHKTLTLHLSMEGLRSCGILLQPIVPKISATLLDKLSIPFDERYLRDIKPYSWQRDQNGENKELLTTNDTVLLFRKIRKRIITSSWSTGYKQPMFEEED